MIKTRSDWIPFFLSSVEIKTLPYTMWSILGCAWLSLPHQFFFPPSRMSASFPFSLLEIFLSSYLLPSPLSIWQLFNPIVVSSLLPHHPSLSHIFFRLCSCDYEFVRACEYEFVRACACAFGWCLRYFSLLYIPQQ